VNNICKVPINIEMEKIMTKFIKIPVEEVEAITFDEFVEYGKNNGGNIVHGMPWSFNYNGYPVTHEHNECYLIPTHKGTLRFTPQDMLLTLGDGEVYPCNIGLFNRIYIKV
jgi:hypothetical protein